MFLAYALCLLVLAYLLSRRISTPDAFFVCGRKASAPMVALSICASCVGGSATIGMVGLSWQTGTPAFWWLGSGALGLCVLTIFLAKEVRRTGAQTLPEMLENVTGNASRRIASYIIVVAWLAILAAQFSALAAIIAPMTGWSFGVSLYAGAALLVAYTLLGGQAAVMRSDMWQFAILIAALLAALLYLLGTQGTEELFRTPIEAVNAEFPASRLRYYLLILGGSYVVCPMLFGRLLSAKDGKAAYSGSAWAILGLVATAVVIVALGLMCRGLVPAHTPAEEVLTRALLEQLPAWLSPLILLGLFSAIISSADSCLMTAGSVCSNDIFRKPSIVCCRVCMVVLGGAGLLLAQSGKGILPLLLMANDVYVCGVVVPVFIAMLGQKYCRFHPQGIALAMVAGGALGLLSASTGNTDYSYAGLACAAAISLLSVRKKYEKNI